MTSSVSQFDRPVFILAAPRSGSTLLFELLMQVRDVWTIGDESHGVFESIPELLPGQGVTSNRLTASEASAGVVLRLKCNFLELLRNRNGARYPVTSKHAFPVRMVEKTPKNALRVPFLKAAFPDAMFIYLYRDPKENISSIIEAWRSDRFITYPNLRGPQQHWSLLLPPDWVSKQHSPLEEIAAYQWKTANQTILSDLQHLPPQCWSAVSYRTLLDNPETEVCRLCEFMGTGIDEHLLQTLRGKLPLSRFTLTPPTRDKWRKNERLLTRVIPELRKFTQLVEKKVKNKSASRSRAPNPETALNGTIGRNTPCPCGSGRKYKYCHGRVA